MSEYETYEEWRKTWPKQWEPIYGPGGGVEIPVPPSWYCEGERRPPPYTPNPGGPTRDGWDAGRKPLLEKTEQALQKIYNGDVAAAVRMLREMVGK